MKIVLDTNFWLLPARTKTDVLLELKNLGYSPILLSSVLSELEGLKIGTSKTAQAAQVALSLIKRKGLKSTPSSGKYADSAITQYCSQNKAAVATMDSSLRRELRRLGVPVVTANRSGTIKHEEQHVSQTQSPRPHPRTTRSVRS